MSFFMFMSKKYHLGVLLLNFCCTGLFAKEVQQTGKKCGEIISQLQLVKTEIKNFNEENAALKLAVKGRVGLFDRPMEEVFGVKFEKNDDILKRISELNLRIEKINNTKSGKKSLQQSCLAESQELSQNRTELEKVELTNLKLKVSFLMQSPEKRKDYFDKLLESSIVQQAINIDDKIALTHKNMNEVDLAKRQAEQALKEADDRISMKFAEEKLKIEIFRKHLAQVSNSWFTELKKCFNQYVLIESAINEIEYSIDSQYSKIQQSELQLIYGKVKKQWRQLIDDGFNIYHLAFDRWDIGDVPVEVKEIIGKLDDKRRDSYLASLAQVKNEVDSLSQSKKEILEASIDEYFSVLKTVSFVRANLLSQIDSNNLTLDAGSNYIKDIFREFWAIPVHLVGIAYSKYVSIRSDLSNGLLGIWNLFKSLSILLFLMLFPFFARKFTKFSTDILNSYRKHLLKNRRNADRISLRIAIWIQRIAPYVPLMCYLVVLDITEYYLFGSIYEELALILPFFKYFLVYRMFRLIVTDVLQSLQARVQLENREAKPLIDETTKIVGQFFLVSYSLMHLTEITVDQGIIYNHMLLFMRILGVFVCAFAVIGWREYLIPAVKNFYPGKISSFLADRCQSKLAFLFCLPTLSLVLVKILGESIWDWIGDFETSKRFFAKLYRKKVESMGAEVSQGSLEKIPKSYCDLFSFAEATPKEFIVEANQQQFEVVKAEINGWLTASEDDQSIVIYGEKGIGKTTLLGRVAKEISEVDFISISISSKLATEESLANFLSESFKIEKTNNLTRCVLEFNKKVSKKTVLLIDDAHNLFLGKVGGFEAIKAFIDVMSLQTENIFWCVAFNEYSWSYLKGVLGTSEYFRTEVYLNSWSDTTIRDLIKKRHKTTSYSLSYDKIILASRSASSNSEAVVYAEEQFFRLLWEQSNGNPKVALFLWLKCLSPRGHKILKVGLPERPNTDKLSFLEDNAWFVLSAVANHENANRKEISEITNLALGPVNHAIKLASEEKLLHKGQDKRYQISFSYQYDLIRQLKIKNFIYGLD